MSKSVRIEALPYDFTCYWRIENFTLQPNKNFSIQSTAFEIKELESKWFLEVAEEDGSLGVFLFKETDPKYCLIKFRISLLTNMDWVPVTENPSYRHKDGRSGYGMLNVMSVKKLKENPWIHLPNGSLTVSFRVINKLLLYSESSQCFMVSRMINEEESMHRPTEYFSNLKPSDLLSFPPTYQFHSKEMLLNANDQIAKDVQTRHTQTESNVEKEVRTRHTQTDAKAKLEDSIHLVLLKKEKFSFVTLRTPNKEFVVQKSILCANSPVFTTIFESQENGKECTSIEIEDMDSETMTLFVHFLHFQFLDYLCWDSAVTLYYAAQKYQIALLKEECIAHLRKELSVENVCDAFLLADLHEDAHLMICAQEYFGRNLKPIFTSKRWKEFLCHTELVAKILHHFGEKM